MLPLAVLVLFVDLPPLLRAVAFAVLLGLSNGLVTIVRGAVPLALFGSQGFGALLGKLATPQLFMNAVAPMLFAAFIERAGLAAGEIALLIGAIASALVMEATIRWSNSHLRTRHSARMIELHNHLRSDFHHAVGGDLEVRRRVLARAGQPDEQPLLPAGHLGFWRGPQRPPRQEERGRRRCRC